LPPPLPVIRMSFREMLETGCPGMPVMDDGHVAPVATM